MTVMQPTEIAPLAVRGLMPKDYLKAIQEQVKAEPARYPRVYSVKTISDVVVKAQTTHVLWPLIMQLAKREQRRREKEQAANEQYLRSIKE